VQYDFSDAVMAYVTASKGYRAAGFNSLVLADPVNFGAPYKPEFAKSYEVGLKVDAFERKLRLNAAAYLEKLTDLQTLALVSNGGFITQNAAASEIKGLELEATLVPISGLTLFASFTYMDGKYTKLDAGAVALTSGATDLPLVSKTQTQIGGTYKFGLPNSGKLAFSADYGRRSKYQVTAALDPFSISNPGGRANASVTYTSPSSKMDLFLAATNVTDAKTYYNDIDFIPGVFGYKAALEPRVWRVGIRYRF
jgi:iron complex outermembrane receptor protein